MPDSKVADFTASAYSKAWVAQDAARQAGSAIKKYPKRTAAKVGSKSLDVVVKKPVEGVCHVAVEGAKALWEPIPWSVKGTVKVTVQAWADGQEKLAAPKLPKQVAVPSDLIGPQARQALLDGLSAAHKTGASLNAAPPSVKVNWSQYALHVGCMLPLKAAKLLGIAAVVHSTPLGHTALGHLLSPSGEQHLMALAHLHPPEEIGLAVGAVSAIHSPFARTLQNSNLSEFDTEKSNYMAEQAKARTQMRTLRRAISLQSDLAKATGPVPRCDVEQLQEAVALARTVSAPTPPVSQPATTAALPPKKAASAVDLTEQARKFISTHPANRASDKSWERISHNLEKRADAFSEKAQKIASKIEEQQSQLADTKWTPGEKARIGHRVAKLQNKKDLADVRARRKDLEVQLRGVAPIDYTADKHAAYVQTKRDAAALKVQRLVNKGLQERSSEYVRPNEESLEAYPVAFRTVKTFAWYSVAVAPLVNLPYWGVRALMRRTAQNRLDKQLSKADALLASASAPR